MNAHALSANVLDNLLLKTKNDDTFVAVALWQTLMYGFGKCSRTCDIAPPDPDMTACAVYLERKLRLEDERASDCGNLHLKSAGLLKSWHTLQSKHANDP